MPPTSDLAGQFEQESARPLIGPEGSNARMIEVLPSGLDAIWVKVRSVIGPPPALEPGVVWGDVFLALGAVLGGVVVVGAVIAYGTVVYGGIHRALVPIVSFITSVGRLYHVPYQPLLLLGLFVASAVGAWVTSVSSRLPAAAAICLLLAELALIYGGLGWVRDWCDRTSIRRRQSHPRRGYPGGGGSVARADQPGRAFDLGCGCQWSRPVQADVPAPGAGSLGGTGRVSLRRGGSRSKGRCRGPDQRPRRVDRRALHRPSRRQEAGGDRSSERWWGGRSDLDGTHPQGTRRRRARGFLVRYAC